MQINKEIVTKEFIVTENELKKKLGITGTIGDIQLFSGLSPDEEEKNISTGKNEWLITTYEIKNQKGDD